MPYRNRVPDFPGSTLSPEERGEVARLNEQMDAFGAQVVIHEQAVPTWFSIETSDYGSPLSRHGSVTELRNRVAEWRAPAEAATNVSAARRDDGDEF